MLTELQKEIYFKLCELSGEEVINLITDWLGCHILDADFKEFLEDEGVL